VLCLWETNTSSLRSGLGHRLPFELFHLHGEDIFHLFLVLRSQTHLRQDCGAVVASLFIPIDGPDGKQFPLCEKDYFRRLSLICAKCETALRGSYITACSMPPPLVMLLPEANLVSPRQKVPRGALHLLNLSDALRARRFVLRARE
jgi:hypothetical protein